MEDKLNHQDKYDYLSRLQTQTLIVMYNELPVCDIKTAIAYKLESRQSV